MQTMTSYKKLCTQFYDLDKPTAPSDALGFYLQYAREAGGAVLEAMCGSGRFLIPMMQAGIDMDGLDASSDMLEACRQKCAMQGIQPRLYQQFLNEMELPRAYKLIFIPAGSFGLITNLEQIRESLKRIFDVLQPDGKLLLEIELVTQLESSNSGNWGGRWLKPRDGAVLAISWLPTYDATTQTSHSLHRYDLFQNGTLIETELEEFDLRHYRQGELEGLLEETGFVNMKALKLLDHQPAEDAETEIMIEATRP
jgi:SAM-dependent methyltransferase